MSAFDRGTAPRNFRLAPQRANAPSICKSEHGPTANTSAKNENWLNLQNFTHRAVSTIVMPFGNALG